jgi:SEC-C motif-containing protein
METALCPCGSKRTLSECCLPVLEGTEKAQTAEALLRARYTAFTRGNVDFIWSTHDPRTRRQIRRQGIEEWSKSSEWLGLEIVDVQGGSAADKTATIVFHAQYRAEGQLNDHHEKATFQRQEEGWVFVDGEPVKPPPVIRAEPKVGRNEPCPCGSGKKYKKCCGSAA